MEKWIKSVNETMRNEAGINKPKRYKYKNEVKMTEAAHTDGKLRHARESERTSVTLKGVKSDDKKAVIKGV